MRPGVWGVIVGPKSRLEVLLMEPVALFFREVAGENPAGVGRDITTGRRTCGAPSLWRGGAQAVEGVIQWLHWALKARPAPETVCKAIDTLIGRKLMYEQRGLILRAAHSRPAKYSSMPEEFDKPVPLTHKVRTLGVLFGREWTPEQIEKVAVDPWRLL